MAWEGGGPVQDQADYVSAFMSLPETVQCRMLMHLFAAMDVAADEVQPLRFLLQQASEVDVLGETTRHYLQMCEHLFTSLELAQP